MRRPTLHRPVGLIVCGVLSAMLAGGCAGGCETIFQPLPKPVPASQTIEGGAQVRVTKNGLKTITAAAKQIIANLTANGICIPRPSDVDLGFLGDLRICARQDCFGGATGCRVNLSLGNVATSAPNASTLRADVTFSGSATVPITYVPPIFDDITCNLGASMSNARLVVDVRIGTNPGNGELDLHLDRILALDINPNVNLCDLGLPSDIVSFIVDGILDLLGTNLGLLIVNLITPTIDGFIQGLLPRPLGIEGVVDIGALLSSIAPGIVSKVEVRGVPGGYASLPAEGVSVGVIVGINADRDTASRGAADASQPALCVPQWSAPDLGAPPMSLSKAPGRQTFALKPAGAFMGVPDPTTDIAIGLSGTLLDLAGHHVVASGALCLGIGSAMVPQLNLGTIGILVRSLAELGRTGKEPILLQMRPTTPITFDIGAGTATSPYLTAHLKDLEIDFYALIFERYVRGFTIATTLDLGVNLEFMLDAQHNPVIVPVLVGLDTSKIKVKVSNAQLLRETTMQLEAVFPTLLNLFIPLLTEGIPDFPVPAVEGFTLGDLRLGKTSTSEDDFLSIYASLRKANGKPLAVARARSEARLRRVTTPPPEQIMAFLAGEKGGALPEVEIDLGGAAPGGGDLEWQWNLNGGMWRPFSSDRRLVIRDLALAIQGKHTIQVRSRAAGNYETTELGIVEIPVIIDSVPPSFAASGVRRDGDELVLQVSDLVSSDRDLQLALGPAGAAAPTTAWAATEGRLAAADLDAVAGADGRVTVFARDQVGNVSHLVLDLGRSDALRVQRGAPADSAGFGCHVGDGGAHDHGGGWAAILGALLPLSLLLRRKLWRVAGVLGALLSVGSCSTAKLASVECLSDVECAALCPMGQIGTCDSSGVCKCSDDIPIGLVGSWSDLAVAANGDAWVSSYNSDLGDLMVAKMTGSGRIPLASWEFADGIPAGPVVNAVTSVRGGVREPGDDVGLYTSIAVSASGEPMVAHYDRTNQSLRFASRAAGKWTAHAVDAGATNSKDIGRYASLTLDAMGRPGIAYLATLRDGRTSHTEVRFAQAKTVAPASATDWTQVVIESKAVPPDPSGGMLDDIPFVNGVFINSARTSTGEPIVVYYDRTGGDLKLAEYNKATSTFKAPVVVDGAGAGNDVGWYPSVAVSSDGKAQISYLDPTHNALLAIVYPGGQREMVDDGLRQDGMTTTGMARPVYHLVGAGSTVMVADSLRAAVYQDGTGHELLLSTRSGATWTRSKIAGSETPFKGAYGFFSSAARTASGEIVMSSFVMNQAMHDQWVEVFRKKP